MKKEDVRERERENNIAHRTAVLDFAQLVNDSLLLLMVCGSRSNCHIRQILEANSLDCYLTILFGVGEPC